MLSIFDQSETEQQPERKLNFDRLQTVLEPRRPAAGERLGTVAVEEPPKAKLAPPAVRPFEPRPPVAPPEPHAKSAPLPAPQDDAIPAELHKFAEQFTRDFRQVLVSTVKDIQGPAHKMEDMKSELDAASQKIDALVRAVQELSQKLDQVENAGIIATTVAHATRDAQQAIEKRLDMQAGVLRTLHNGNQSREERLDKLLATFQSLQNMDSQSKPLNTLPDSL
jgi:hypothetical protein